MKKICYIFGLILLMGATLLIFEKYGYSAPRRNTSTKRQANTSKKKSTASNKRAATTSGKRTSTASNKRAATSTKRAAVSSASTKRAATSGTARRAATSGTARRAATSSASTKRMMSRGASRRSVTAATTKTTAQTSSSKLCPFDEIIKIEFDEEDPTLPKTLSYRENSKTVTCAFPDSETTEYIKWEADRALSYPGKLAITPKWVAISDAYYLICRNGYVENEVDGQMTCVPYSDICPLNEPIEKKGNDYINPRTLETCQKLKHAGVKELAYEEYVENYYNDYAYDDISIFECPANWYSVNSSVNPSISVECKACPYADADGKKLYSPKGSTEIGACRPACSKDPETGKDRISIKVGNSYICKACADGAKFNGVERTCETQAGYTCWENGTRCEKTLTEADCPTGFDHLDKENNKCVCPEGWLGDGLKSGTGCIKPCGANATLQADNSCKCNAGYIAGKDQYDDCILKPNLTANDCVAGATFTDGLCKCPDGTFGDGLKDNETSPYCKIMGASDPTCKNTYANNQGTQIPRGCITNCSAGTYWGTNE